MHIFPWLRITAIASIYPISCQLCLDVFCAPMLTWAIHSCFWLTSVNLMFSSTTFTRLLDMSWVLRGFSAHRNCIEWLFELQLSVCQFVCIFQPIQLWSFLSLRCFCTQNHQTLHVSSFCNILSKHWLKIPLQHFLKYSN